MNYCEDYTYTGEYFHYKFAIVICMAIILYTTCFSSQVVSWRPRVHCDMAKLLGLCDNRKSYISITPSACLSVKPQCLHKIWLPGHL